MDTIAAANFLSRQPGRQKRGLPTPLSVRSSLRMKPIGCTVAWVAYGLFNTQQPSGICMQITRVKMTGQWRKEKKLTNGLSGHYLHHPISWICCPSSGTRARTLAWAAAHGLQAVPQPLTHLLFSTRCTARNKSLHSLPSFCLLFPFVICFKAGWRKPTTAVSMSCPHSRRRWRVSALESCGGGRSRSGAGRLTDMQLKARRRARARARERVVEKGSIWMSCTSGFKIGATSQYRDRIDALSDLAPPCVRGSPVGIQWPQADKWDANGTWSNGVTRSRCMQHKCWEIGFFFFNNNSLIRWI